MHSSRPLRVCLTLQIRSGQRFLVLKISSAPVFWIWLLDVHERAKRKELAISPLHFLSQLQAMQRTDLTLDCTNKRKPTE